MAHDPKQVDILTDTSDDDHPSLDDEVGQMIPFHFPMMDQRSTQRLMIMLPKHPDNPTSEIGPILHVVRKIDGANADCVVSVETTGVLEPEEYQAIIDIVGHIS